MPNDSFTKNAPNDAEPSLVLEPGVVIAQKYRLEKLLKRGGMGSVWTAIHLGLDTTVAIKFMNARMFDLAGPAYDEDEQSGTPSDPRALSRARFEREAKAAARIRSTNVVQMLDHGIDHGMPYIVMELLRGEDLEVRLKRVSRLSFDELVPIVNAVARALQLAHAEELVHRDLKPENIYLAKEGDEEIPKILDFGVAKAKRSPGENALQGGTSDGTMVGTPHYMSPEQIQAGAHVDHRTDIWALGVVIFRSLTGRLPFPSQGLLELAMQICREPIPRATSINPELPPSIDAFFDKILNRDVNARFQSAREVVAALQEIAASRQVTAMTTGVSTASVVTNALGQDKPAFGGRTPVFVMAGLVLTVLVGGGLLFAFRSAPADRASTDPSASRPASTALSDLPRPPVSIMTAPASDPPAASASAAPTPAVAPTPNTTFKSAVNKSAPTSTATGTTKTKKRNVGY